MNTERSAGLAVRIALATSVSLTPFATLQAQEPPAEVIVTGSRIARPSDFESPSPVITVDHDAIEKSGYSNLQQLMDRVPANGNGAFSTRGNNQDSTANGAASISLRGLGADATLVLVNGRRVAISPFAESVTTNFVDINSLPVAAIERVEVLKDGSSAVYGSDAVAGVVNVILRKDFTGFETSVGYGNVTSGPYDEKTASAIWGTGGDDSNVTLIFDYFKNSTLANVDRASWSLATPNQTARGGEDFRSSRSFPGRFKVNNVLQVDPACPPGQTVPGACVYDYGPWNLLVPQAERSGLMLLAHQDIGGGARVFTELAVQHNTSMAQGAPTPLDDTASMTVPANHPNNPFPGATTIAIDRFRTVDAGPCIWHIQSDNLRGVIGLQGEFAKWNYEVSAQRARSESDQTGNRGDGWVRTDFLQTEINAGRYNPFGGAINSQSEIAAISTSLVRRGKAELSLFSAGVSGALFDLPAESVRMAAGVEYREEEVSDVPDDQFQRGLIFGTEAVSAAASRNIYAAYVEFSVPILKSLELSLAGRYDHYNDFGSTTNPKVAVRWSPVESLALRSSWGTGFRAPSLAQVGLGPSQSSQFFKDDFGCAVNPGYCASTDRNLVFSGNPRLDAEKSHSFNGGAAWKPSGNLEVTLDYWDIVQKNKVDAVPLGFLYSQFCNDQNSTVCIRGTPLPGERLGPLQQINSTFVNIGEQSASGLDLGGYFGFDAGPGRLALGLQYSHLLKFERVELDATGQNFIRRSLDGEYEYPEDRAALTADWSSTSWGVYANLNYVGTFQDQPDFDFNGSLDYDQHDTRLVGSFTTLNLQLRYTGIKNTKLLLGIDNVLDQRPPFAIGDGDTDLYGYVQSQHSPRGRFWNAKAVFTF
jgi:outer membrane receptor for ferrienterochelin and colicin